MTMWPLWQCLSSKALVFLADYQWKTFGTKLDIVIHAHEEKNVNIQVSYPSLDQIDKTMREPPKRVRRIQNL